MSVLGWRCSSGLSTGQAIQGVLSAYLNAVRDHFQKPCVCIDVPAKGVVHVRRSNAMMPQCTVDAVRHPKTVAQSITQGTTRLSTRGWITFTATGVQTPSTKSWPL
eukprot:scaffold148946_cov35-Tisochrysis_lutea.AAC.3